MLNLISSPLLLVINIFALLVALTIHEFSHAVMADRLGDPTPRLQGRISLNPLAHLDPFGTLFMFFFGFGWGKPVQFDPFNLKNPRKDAALISLAGPASNFILAVLLSILLRLFILFHLREFFLIGSFILEPIIVLNIYLGFFNLIPIHPLDGFKIVGGLLSREKAREWDQLERYGFVFLLLLIFPLSHGSMLSNFLQPVATAIINLLLPVTQTAGIM